MMMMMMMMRKVVVTKKGRVKKSSFHIEHFCYSQYIKRIKVKDISAKK